MVSQEILWSMIKEHPGHPVEYYADILANGNKAKKAFCKEDIYSCLTQLRKWKLITDEWDFCENGPLAHYYPINLIQKGDNKDYCPSDYFPALVEDRVKRGWSKESAEYAFPKRSNVDIKYLSKFNKGILNYIRKNEGCTFQDIGGYLCIAHRRCGYVPKCLFNAHLEAVLKDLIEGGNIRVGDLGKYYFIKK